MKTPGEPVASGLWRWLSGMGLERFDLYRAPDGWRLHGTILTSDGGVAAEARYQVACDAAWRTTRVEVGLSRDDAQRSLRLDVEHGRWIRDGSELAAARGCVDVDLSWTPATNTLSIRRLGLGVGESSGVLTAAWVRVPELAREPLPQEFHRLDERRYRYASRGVPSRPSLRSTTTTWWSTTRGSGSAWRSADELRVIHRINRRGRGTRSGRP